MKRLNKVIVQYNTKFYYKSWTQQNKIIHNLEVFRTYLIEQNTSIKKTIKDGNKR